MTQGGKESSTVEELASRSFQNLSEAELRLLASASTGKAAHCGAIDKGPNDPENAAGNAHNWGSSREIRADLIVWLCTDPAANEYVHSKGLTVVCAKILGALDLSAIAVRFPLMFFQCCFSAEIRALYCSLVFLSMDGCVVRPGLRGGAAVLADSLRTRALNLRRCVINGEVNLRAVEIENNLECDGGLFLNPSGSALSVNAARIGRSVFLRKGFRAEGEVNLCGATFGSLDCSGATFERAGGRALAGDDAKINRKVDLSGVKATGVMSFVAADIGSDLALDNSDFTHATLRLERARMKGSLFARSTQFGHDGFLDLSGAFAGGIDDDAESWPSSQHVDLDGFTFDYLRRPDEALRRLELLARQPLSGSQGARQRVKAQPYRHLARVLREMGYERESRQILIGLERERDRRETFNVCQKFLRSLYRITLRYGYEPQKSAVMIAIMFFLLGWVFVSLGTSAGLMDRVSELTKPEGVTRAQPTQLSPMLYSLDVLLPIHGFEQEVNWLCLPKTSSWMTRG
jgi:hypothetical protein